ncbi:MAG: hypothetical protein Q8O26_00200 [Phreatobacter sp.]|uniref:hypothetical protein n=1 Tax=Phreatobacter sp. TaxID=1966341 RepID=UPI002734EE75|nr:hypothetical protein [Phreatobacter sp.]MDP2800284.1 hypothetical protein [Phreatobacter sp.]
MGFASADSPASRRQNEDDGLVALVLWRLHDPAWNPSFRDLLEDARTCDDPATEATTVLSVLRAVVTADHALAPRARTLAVQALEFMAARGPAKDGTPTTPAPSPRRRLANFRPAFLTT